MERRGEMLPEDQEEREQFNKKVKELADGNPLIIISQALSIMSAMAPEHGTYSKMCAIYSNELEKIIIANKSNNYLYN